MPLKCSLLAILCAFFFAIAPARAENEDKERPLRASELSPLARTIDAILFGDGVGNVAAYERNIFVTKVDPETFKSAIQEVRRFRGKKYDELERTGSTLYKKFREDVQNEALAIAKREDRFFNPPRRLTRSWTALTGQNFDGEEPLEATEIGRRAQERTEAQVPFAFQGYEALGMQDYDAKTTYQRNAHRIEIFETQPKQSELSRAEFEAWREREIEALALTMATNRIRILQSEARRGANTFLWQNLAEPDPGRWTALTAEEIGEVFQPPGITRDINGNKVRYKVLPLLALNIPDSRKMVSHDWLKQGILAKPMDEANRGSIDETAAAEQHLGALLAVTNQRTNEAIKKLNEFSYEQYKKDRGKGFFANLKKFNRETLDTLYKKHDLPSFAASVPGLGQLTPGFELVAWGKFAGDKNFWSTPRERKETWLDFFRMRYPEPWRHISAEPPTPLSAHIEHAKSYVWDKTKRFGWIPAAVGGLIAAHQFTQDGAPTPSKNNIVISAPAEPGATSTYGGKATATSPAGSAAAAPLPNPGPPSNSPPTKPSASEPEVVHLAAVRTLDPKPGPSLPKPEAGGATDARAGEAPASDSLPPGLSNARANATNKPLKKEDRAYFRIESDAPPSELPRRFSLGAPENATETLNVPAETSAAKFYVKNALLHRGPAEIPTGENSRLASLVVTGEDNEVWRPGIDYELKATKAGEPVVFPTRAGRFSSRAGFAEKPTDERGIQDESLRELDHGRLGEVAKDLRKHGFTYLPDMIDMTVVYSKEKQIPISIFDLKDVLTESAYYSQVKEKRARNPAILDEFEQASRFLNPEGLSCYECDAARELAVELYLRTLRKKTGIEISPRNVIGRKEDSLELTRNGLHADFAIHDYVHQQSFILDTTPNTMDPRDPHPPSGEQVGFVTAPAQPPSESSNVHRERKKLAMPGPAPMPKISEKKPDESMSKFSFSEAVVRLFKLWNEADPRQAPARPLTRASYAAAGPPEPPPHEAVEEKTAVAAVETQPAGPKEGQAKKFKMVPDERLEALENRISAAAKSFAQMRVVPKKLGDGFAAIPTLNLVRAARFIESRVRGDISDSDFEKGAAEFAGKDFKMPGGFLNQQIHAFIAAVEVEQLRLIDVYAEAWKRGNRDYPGLLGPSVPYEIKSLVKWVAERQWQAPRSVVDSPPTSLCAALGGAAAE